MRTTAGLATSLLLALCLVGCGGSGDDSGGVASAGGSKPSGAAAQSTGDIKDAGLKYSQCMRDNGIANFPDPVIGDNGQMTFDAPDDVPDPQMNEAESKCRQHLPFNPAEDVDPQRIEAMRAYSQCMRENGFAEFPDPEADGSSRVNWEKMGVSGPDDPKVKAADDKCKQLRPSAPAGANGGNG